MRRLESAGVIRGHAALLENGLVGLRVTACVEVSLVDPSGANMRTFERRMQACPQLIQCSELSGDVDYLLTVVAEDLSGFASCTRKFLADNDRIRAYRSMLVLRQTKNEHVLPIG